MTEPDPGYDDYPVERMPPHDVVAEQSVLGGVMISEKALGEVTETLTDERDFYQPKHAELYRTILDIAGRGEPVDAVKVAAVLRERGTLAKVGGAPYLHTLISTVPTAANATHYAAIVKDRAGRRRAVDAGTRIAQLGYSTDGLTLDQIAQAARAEADTIARSASTRSTSLANLIDPALEAAEADIVPGVITPWDDLNSLIGGWRGGRMYLIAARPGVGKTIAAIQASVGLARTGYVSFTSLEMSSQELTNRIIAQVAEVALGRLEPKPGERADRLSQRDWERIAEARPRLSSMTVEFNDNLASGAHDVRNHAKAVARTAEAAGSQLAAVVVDYLQIMDGGASAGRTSRQEIVSGFSRTLKLLAMELDVPVIAVSQLNRGSEQRTDRRPMLSDLRESGSLEQDSDVVILLHQADVYGDPSVDAIVAKNRQGVPGIVELTKEGHYARMVSRKWKRKTAEWSPSGVLEEAS